MRVFIKFSMCIILMITASRGYSQSMESYPEVSNMFKLNFFLPGASYEHRLTPVQTLHSSAFLAFNFQNSSTNGEEQTDILLVPSFSVNFRTYYNIEKRTEKGFNTAMNSANFVAPIYIGRYALTDPGVRRWINQVGMVWGIQRNAPGGFSLDLNLGLSYIFNMMHSSYYAPVELIAQISLGYRIGK